MTETRRKKVTFSIVLLASTLLASLIATPAAEGFQVAGQDASTVIGEPNFVSSTSEATANHLYHPFRIAFDSSGDLWVVDENNNRVLEFKPPFTDGMSASLEIGQANFTSIAYVAAQDRLNEPAGLAFDTSGDLWVMDTLDNRILEFKPPFTDGMNASLELGQPAGPQEFTSNSPSSTADGFNFPVAAAFDSQGDLWVSDRENNRVVEFESPFTDGMNASSVIGQVNTTSVSPFVTTSPDALSGPNGIAFDPQGNLWVADEDSNRVLEFPSSSLGSNDPAAVLEIGQPAGSSQFYTSVIADNSSSFANPLGLAFDPHGDLWVSDRAHSRVLEFDAPFDDGMSASTVVGTPQGPKEFDGNVSGLSQDLFANPLGIAFDPSGDLWVADQLNNRVLEFNAAAVATTATDVDIPVTAAESGISISSSGDSCYQTGEESVCHLAANETSTTAVDVDLIGVASASVANIYSSDMGSQEPGYAQAAKNPLSSPLAFYGVVISGISGGTASVCVAQPRGHGSTTMAYFSGSSWTTPTSVSQGPKSICATIPLSAISSGSSLVEIGTSSGSPSILGPLSTLAWILLLLGAILICGYAIVVRRRGPGESEEEDDDEEGF